ncbi:MAG TPA: glucose 1-dehydrogenase [Thermoplasmata archaeon]|nr:glucose 1-dehydrogenase [Thermoplasmata archaeon]
MRAVVVRPPVPGVALTDVPPPVRAPGQIRVGVLECGVCGTDHDVASGKYGRAPPGSPYLILGHENLGRVLEGDPSVAGFQPGDLVVATVRRGCGRCRFCFVNKSDFCESGGFTERGIGGAHGYMTEQYVEVPEYLVHVDPALRPVAVLLEPLSVVEKAILQGQVVLDRKEPTPGHARAAAPSALVAGTGAIGMLAAFVLRVRGYEVVAIDRHDDSTPAARTLARVGATHANAAAGLAVLGSRTFDLVVEATGSVTLDFGLANLLGPNGVLVLTGIPDASGPPTAVSAGTLWREVVLGNRAIVGSVNANRTYFESGLADMATFEARWPGALASLISARRPLADVADVLAEHLGGTIKTVLEVAPG